MLGQEKKVCMVGDRPEVGGLDTVCPLIYHESTFSSENSEAAMLVFPPMCSMDAVTQGSLS